MEFTLIYQGELKANRGPKEKHVLRLHFHEQLKKLWQQPPLDQLQNFLRPSTEPGVGISLNYEIGPLRFAPLVGSRLSLFAELEITLLRPEPVGNFVSQSGDVDNRIKTLLDALRLPSEQELPAAAATTNQPALIFCLLEDDRLISSLKISTEQLLVKSSGRNEVVLIIRVKVKATQLTHGNLAFLG